MKRYSFLLIIIFSFLFLYTSAQPGFNKLLYTTYDMTDIRDMLIVNDTIIGYGIGFDNPVNGNQGLVLTKFDSNGILLKSTIILDSLGDPLAVGKTWGKIIATQDGGFAMTASIVGRNCALLIKTDRDFEVEFIKEYEDTVNLSNFRYKLFEVDNGFMLYGSVQGPNLKLLSFVRRVDKHGNPVWFNYYGVENWDDNFIYGSQISDTLYVFGGVQSGATLGQGISFLNFINEEGEIIRNWSSGPHPEMGYLRSFRLLSDGGIIVFGQYLVEETGVNSGYFQASLSKLNNDLEYEWVNYFGRVETSVFREMFWDIEPLSNDNFIGAGQSRVDINGKSEPSGWLMKFSAEGDSIWSRHDFPDFPVDSLGDTFFGGVGVLSSGSIVAGGTATLWNKDAIWLVKVTNDGCLDTIFCGLVPTEFTPAPDEGQLTLFPNPANESLTIQFEKPSSDKRLIQFFNLQGQMVFQTKIGRGLKESMSISGLPEGFYLVTVGDKHFVQQGKIFIQH